MSVRIASAARPVSPPETVKITASIASGAVGSAARASFALQARRRPSTTR
jgi:hypothetical protein